MHPEAQHMELSQRELEIDSLDHIKDFIGKEIKGQDAAVDKVAGYINQIELGLHGSSQGPLARWVEIGPAGVGKTETVMQAIKYLLDKYPQKEQEGVAKYLLKINGAEFQHGHEVAKLIGSPPGYIGSAKGGNGNEKIEPFFSEVNINKSRIKLSNGQSIFFVLIDEVEKTHPDFQRLLLGPLDKGELRLGDNTAVDFSDAIFVFTSNLGNQEVAKERKRSIGFAPAISSGNNRQNSLRLRAYEELFPPELRSRMGGEQNVVIFEQLDKETFSEILDKDIAKILERFSVQGCRITLNLTEDARAWFLEKGTNADTGARNMASLLDREILQSLARGSMDPLTKKPNLKILDGRSFDLDLKGGKIVFLENRPREKDYNKISYESLPGVELWPGLKFNVSESTLKQLNLQGTGMVIDRVKKIIHIPNLNFTNGRFDLILVAEPGDKYDYKTSYISIEPNGIGYKILVIDNRGQNRGMLVGNSYIKQTDML